MHFIFIESHEKSTSKHEGNGLQKFSFASFRLISKRANAQMSFNPSRFWLFPPFEFSLIHEDEIPDSKDREMYRVLTISKGQTRQPCPPFTGDAAALACSRRNQRVPFHCSAVVQHSTAATGSSVDPSESHASNREMKLLL